MTPAEIQSEIEKVNNEIVNQKDREREFTQLIDDPTTPPNHVDGYRKKRDEAGRAWKDLSSRKMELQGLLDASS